MRHLEMMLGADNLRDGLRVYLRNHAFGNASWPDRSRCSTRTTET
jgi:aminopeptidase N